MSCSTERGPPGQETSLRIRCNAMHTPPHDLSLTTPTCTHSQRALNEVSLIPAFLLLLDLVLIGSQAPVLLPFGIVFTQTVRAHVAVCYSLTSLVWGTS